MSGRGSDVEKTRTTFGGVILRNRVRFDGENTATWKNRERTTSYNTSASPGTDILYDFTTYLPENNSCTNADISSTFFLEDIRMNRR